ncbi:hypothetical protein Y032_0122g1061 [Ancylostoma ceylanicum]|uniref:Uncharacterized protein n=1 Tax=Ancylostoma ceylanicum TaxID=53326 RepID=A0A016T9W3_9BILA|nr:hypothetical protein Y032_0122g1061 [Ancylostoma ceylanicum]
MYSGGRSSFYHRICPPRVSEDGQAARAFEDCSRDTHTNRPITAQQRTSCHAAVRRGKADGRCSMIQG